MINPDTFCLFFLLATRFCLVATTQAYSSVFQNGISNWPDWYNEFSCSFLGTSWGILIWINYDYNMKEDEETRSSNCYGNMGFILFSQRRETLKKKKKPWKHHRAANKSTCKSILLENSLLRELIQLIFSQFEVVFDCFVLHTASCICMQLINAKK